MLTPLEVTSSLSTCCGLETAIEKVIILHLHRRFSALNHSKSVYLYACVYVCIIEAVGVCWMCAGLYTAGRCVGGRWEGAVGK